MSWCSCNVSFDYHWLYFMAKVCGQPGSHTLVYFWSETPNQASASFQLTHLCFWMSLTPFFRFPSLSEGLSLLTQTVTVQLYFVDNNNEFGLHSWSELLRHTVPPTCRASWWGWQRSWWSSWGTQSCRCLSGWCCRFSLDLDLKMEDWRHTEIQ